VRKIILCIIDSARSVDIAPIDNGLVAREWSLVMIAISLEPGTYYIKIKTWDETEIYQYYIDLAITPV